MEKDIMSRINNKVNLINEQIVKLDKQKMSRQKLQCTANYKNSLREQRRLEDEQRKYELHKEIVSNPDRTIEEWKTIFENNAKKQVEKNLRDKNKKRISQKTYEKRERRIVAEYKQKLVELDELNKEIEQFGIKREMLIEELNKRITNNKVIINSKKDERKQLREQNELNNQEIDKQKAEYIKQLNDLELLSEDNKFAVKTEVTPITDELGDYKFKPQKELKDIEDFDFKHNNASNKDEVNKSDKLDMSFRPKNKEVKEKKKLEDFSFSLRETNEEEKANEVIKQNIIEEKNVNTIEEIDTFEQRTITNAFENIEKPNNDLDVINVVNNGFAHMKFNVDDLKQYNKTVFDFSGANRLKHKERKYYRKLARDARDNGVSVIGYENNETLINKIVNKIFRKNVEVKIEQNSQIIKDTEWRKRIVVSRSNHIDFEDDKQVYANTRKKVAITR